MSEITLTRRDEDMLKLLDNREPKGILGIAGIVDHQTALRLQERGLITVDEGKLNPEGGYAIIRRVTP